MYTHSGGSGVNHILNLVLNLVSACTRDKKTHRRRVRRKLNLVCDSWFLGCNQGPCKLYPCTVSTPIDTASISLIFRKIPVMVRCIITGLERGEGFAQLWNFSNFLGTTRPPCMSTQKYSCENAAAPNPGFRRGRRRS